MALAAQASKSPFATLLKRSKFSSFDPAIAQVYTTHGGDAHRGNWGFKRPLPLRRRGAYITVKAVDSLEQQTEWNSAEPQAMWMKNWDELQVNPAQEESLLPSRRSQRDDTAYVTDSEYAPERTDLVKWRPFAIPNIHAMSNSQFKQYLAHIHRKRQSFFSHKHKRTSNDPRNLFSNQIRGDSLDEFAVWESQKKREDRRSRSLESVPHRSAGLHYPHFTPLQTYLSTKERKGRLVEEVKGERGKPLYYVASYAGMGTVVQQKNKGVGPVMAWGDVSKSGATKFRPETVTLERAPEVVGKRQGLKGAMIAMQAVACDAQSHSQSNTHRPGSLQYIAAEPLKSFANYNVALPRRSRFDSIVKKSTQARGPPSQTTLDFLGKILQRSTTPPSKNGMGEDVGSGS